MSTRLATVGDCVAVLEQAYPPAWAQSWDAVGLAVGDPEAPVSAVLFAVDPTVEVAVEAAGGAQLLVTHHPLFLRGTHGVAETGPGGRVVATLIRAGVALYTAHTNADVADPGVSDALAAAIGLRRVGPLDQDQAQAEEQAQAENPAQAGGTARPPAGDAAVPAPAVCRGLGRIGELPEPEPLDRFCARVARALPATAGGVRATGAADQLVRRVAVCGGSGGELAGAARAAGADVLVTADGRHHHVLDAVGEHPIAIVDVAHWASEWPWLAQATARLEAGLRTRGRTVSASVSAIVTDPWRLHIPSR
ncbi:Nif3-like dinuclear metal center hexameric protein [Frankia tisae]|uniref:Nif3-like dinuclear metal center hexameric protein n=1 Tax=Frankia tisae TaxID=2950104 RepID=UPI0021BE4BA3|nr:Nif3-like dinuclear metal center hexameric protein [Frankia tisae]